MTVNDDVRISVTVRRAKQACTILLRETDQNFGLRLAFFSLRPRIRIINGCRSVRVGECVRQFLV
jgi:hypothetical protein